MRDLRQGPNPDTILLAALLGLAIWLIAGWAFGQAQPAGAVLDPDRAIGNSQRAIGRTVGDYTLTDSEGRTVRLAEYRGRPFVISFVYTGCVQVCPVTTKFLGQAVAEAQRALGADAFRVVTVGFNWPFDSPSAMSDFRNRQGIDLPGWTFLAADEATLSALATDVGFSWSASAAGFDHVTQATLIDARGRVSRQVYGATFELPMFVGPLKELVNGTPFPPADLRGLVDRIRILCTVYDPRTGRYRLDYGLFIEVFAGLSILVGTAWYLIAGTRRGANTKDAAAHTVRDDARNVPGWPAGRRGA
jgi:protein SCO1/2